MIKRVFQVGGITILSVGYVVYGQTAVQQRPTSNPTALSPAASRELLNTYCVACHNQKARASGLEKTEKLKAAGTGLAADALPRLNAIEESSLRLSLDDKDLAHVTENPETWESVVRKLRAGMMPPSGAKRPDKTKIGRASGRERVESEKG